MNGNVPPYPEGGGEWFCARSIWKVIQGLLHHCLFQDTLHSCPINMLSNNQSALPSELFCFKCEQEWNSLCELWPDASLIFGQNLLAPIFWDVFQSCSIKSCFLHMILIWEKSVERDLRWMNSRGRSELTDGRMIPNLGDTEVDIGQTIQLNGRISRKKFDRHEKTLTLGLCFAFAVGEPLPHR